MAPPRQRTVYKQRGVYEKGKQFWREWERGDEFLEHRRGVAWQDAPIPPADHNCEAQTRALVRVGGLPPVVVMRCRCGAVNLEGEGWEDRNSRKAGS